MEEILRFSGINAHKLLLNYHVSICPGEIVCVQSSVSESLDTLLSILTGIEKPESGRIYLNEKELAAGEKICLQDHQIYLLNLSQPAHPKSRVYEQVGILKKPWNLYQPYKQILQVRQFFEKEQIDINPGARVRSLTPTDQKKLNLLWAAQNHARLVILDLRRENLEGKAADELQRLICQFSQGGMAFLLLSCQYSPLFQLKTRIQYLDQGRVLREWWNLSEKAQRRLEYGERNEGTKIFLPDSAKLSSGSLIGLYDYNWDSHASFWQYLQRVHDNNPEFAEEFGLQDLPSDGSGYHNGIAIIPRNSQQLLLNNLTIRENLTLLARGRVTIGHTPILSPKLERVLVSKVCEQFQIPDSEDTVLHLSVLRRKLVSIERFALLRPKLIILESPYQQLQSQEYKELLAYLESLQKRGTAILLFAQDKHRLTGHCSRIFSLDTGKITRIDTYS